MEVFDPLTATMLAVGKLVAAAFVTLDVGVMRCTVTLFVRDVEAEVEGSNVSVLDRFDFCKSVSAQASFHSFRSIFASAFGDISSSVVFLNMPNTGDELGTAGDSVIDGKSGVFPSFNSGFSRLVLSRLTSGDFTTGFFSRDFVSCLATTDVAAGFFCRLVSKMVDSFGLDVSFLISGENTSDPLELSLKSKPDSCLTILKGLEGESTAFRFRDGDESNSGL